MTNKFGYLLFSFLLAGSCFGQEDPVKRTDTPTSQRFYRLDFVVKEFENDKLINSRAYTTTLLADARDKGASIRAGGRVPFATSLVAGGGKQFSYYDVGVNIDSDGARELPSGQLALNVSAEVSNLVATKENTGDQPPVVRNMKWRSAVMVPVKRPTIIFSSDDPSGNRKMQLELTATPIN